MLVVWFSGLSGAGKTTLARAVASEVLLRGGQAKVIDSEVVRRESSGAVGYDAASRKGNVQRIAELARDSIADGTIVLVACIAPKLQERSLARSIIGSDRFVEVLCSASLSVCEGRDVKGLYRRARSGQLVEFPGVDVAYEAPAGAGTVETGKSTIAECTGQIMTLLSRNGFQPGP